MPNTFKPSRLLLPFIALLVSNSIPIGAKADTSCNQLLSDLASHLKTSRGIVSLQHTTNYQANGQWWGGYTKTSLSLISSPPNLQIGFPGRDNLVGSGSRLISNRLRTLPGPGPGPFAFGQTQPFDIQKPDPISYSIDVRKGTIIFQGRYGPYEINCIGNKFAIVNTGDSIETFTFGKSVGPG